MPPVPHDGMPQAPSFRLAKIRPLEVSAKGMSLHLLHTELAFIGIGVPVGPTDRQVQEGAGLQLNHVSTHWLERRNHSTRFRASSTLSSSHSIWAGASVTGDLVPSALDIFMV